MHTPGPWKAGGFSSVVGVPVMAQPDPAKNTFNVCGVAAPVSREENIANAALIAAAPDLYRAVSEMVRLANMGYEESLREPEESGNYTAYVRAKAALAKARGEA